MVRPKIEFEVEGLARLIESYESGTGLVALHNQYHRTVQTIRRVLAEAGVTIRGRGRPVASK